jgi:hypothetical protein
VNAQDQRAAELETTIRNLRALHGKLGEALSCVSSYAENKAFWTLLGVSEPLYDLMCEASM